MSVIAPNPTTIVEANALFNASLDWDDDQDVVKAKNYRKALRFISGQRPEEFHKAAQGGVDVARFTPTFLANELKQVTQFISAIRDETQEGAGSVGLGIEPNFRGY